MKTLTRKAIEKFLFSREPRKGFYTMAKRYVNYYRGDQNIDMETNGEMRFLKSLDLTKDDVVFDVGANEGDYVQYVKQCDVHCFEPDNRAFRVLQERFPKMKLNNIALSDSVGEMTFYINENQNTLNSHYEIKELADSELKKITVKTDTLDAYCEKKGIKQIDLLKIDVEGHELSVLEGAKNMLKNKAIKAIQFEYGWASIYSRTFLKDFFELLVPLGYTIYKLMPNNNRKLVWSPEEEGSTYANFIAIKN